MAPAGPVDPVAPVGPAAPVSPRGTVRTPVELLKLAFDPAAPVAAVRLVIVFLCCSAAVALDAAAVAEAAALVAAVSAAVLDAVTEAVVEAAVPLFE